MSKSDLNKCKSGFDICKVVQREGGKVVVAKSSHAKIYNQAGHLVEVVPLHKDLHAGILRSILKNLIAAGFILCLVWLAYVLIALIL